MFHCRQQLKAFTILFHNHVYKKDPLIKLLVLCHVENILDETVKRGHIAVQIVNTSENGTISSVQQCNNELDIS
jgi:hypothetical protein